MKKCHTYKSFKINKEAIRLTIISDNKETPIHYELNEAHQTGCELGYAILLNTNFNQIKHFLDHSELRNIFEIDIISNLDVSY